MANQGRIKIGLDFNVNTASLDNVKKTLKSLRNMTEAEIKAAGGHISPMSNMAMKSSKNDLGAMRKELDALDKAFEAAFNPKLGTYELNKFNESLAASGTSAQRVFEAVSSYGAAGESALLDMTTNMLAVDRAAKQVNTTFKKLGDTMMNTLRWTITSTAINTVTGAIQQAYHYALDLDQSLNDIRIVTGKSAEDMEKFARQANKAAKSLGSTTTDYTEASLIYYQQGLSDAEVEARTETTLKAAAITGQSADAVSEQLTAVWNGYKVSANEAELYIDKLSAVAATTAADLEELSTGMSRVASAANVMGVDADQLTAQLATIVSVTREAPESIGTALKTVYARMSDIEAGLDTETTLGEYTSQMAQMGINVLDANGKLRDMGAVVEEIGGKWNSLNREQQVSLAQSIAGTRQYSRMMALFDNWDMYQEALTTSAESMGTLTKQHLTYLDSIEAHQNQLKASTEGLYDSIFNSDEIKGVYDTLSGIITLVDELVQSMGGMPGILATVGMLFAKSAKNSIADLFTKKQTNMLNAQIYKQQLENGRALIEQQQKNVKGNSELENHLQKVLDFEKQIYENADNLTDDQWQELQKGVRAYNDTVQETIRLQQELNTIQDDYKNTFTTTKNDGAITGWRQVIKQKDGTEKEVFQHKSLTIGGAEYWLGEEKDSKTKKGQEKLGLNSAKTRKTRLEEIKIQRQLNQAEEEEYNKLKHYIPIAEKENKIRRRKTEETDQNTEAMKRSANATEQAGNRVEDYLNKINQANKFTKFIDNLTSVAFVATGTSSSIASLTETIQSGEGEFQDYIGSISGIAMSLAPLGKIFWEAGVKAKAAATGVKGFMAAIGPVGWIMLAVTALTSVLSVMSAINKEAQELASKTIKENKVKQEEAEANRDLARSYFEVWDAYKKGKTSVEELKTAAQKLLETTDSQTIKNALLTNSYEELTNAVIKYYDKQNETVKQSATQIKTASEEKLNRTSIGNIKGLHKDWMTFFFGDGSKQAGDIISEGFSSEDEGVHNKKILLETLGEFAYDNGPGAGIGINWPEDPELKAQLYERLLEATGHKEWEAKGELSKNVQSILSNEDYKEAYENYEGSKRTLTETSVYDTIKEDLESYKGSSVTDFSNKRTALIQQVVNTTTYNEEEAAKIVDAQLQKFQNDETQNLFRRTEWLEALKSSELGLGRLNAQELSQGLSLNSLSEAAYNVLSSMSQEEIIGYESVGNLLDYARRKAKQIQQQNWGAQKDSRLEAVSHNLDKLEREAEKKAGMNKVKNLQEQVKELGKQQDILKETKKVAEETYDAEVVAFENLEGVTNNMMEAIKAGNFEEAQKLIEEVTDQDLSNTLQAELASLMQSYNTYHEAIAEFEEAQDKRYETAILQHQEELEYLDTVKEKYEGMINILSELNDLYQAIYGENEFSKLTSNLNKSIDYSFEKYQTDLDKIFKLQTILKDGYGLYTDDQGNTIELNEANREEFEKTLLEAYSSATTNATAYIEAIKAAIENSVSVAFETSFERATGTQFGTGLVEWELASEAADRYLDARERSYRISSLEMDTLSAMNKMSADAQEQMQEALDAQIDSLRKIEKLTEEDIERAERKLDIKRAEIALEEAYNNSTTMQLVRDARTGQWTYDYAVDQDAILKAEEEKRNAIQADREANEQALKDGLNRFLEIRSTLGEQLTRASSEEERKLYLENARTEMNAIVDLVQRLQGDLGDSELLNNTMVQYIMGLNETGIEKILSDVKETPDYTEQISDILEQLKHGIPVHLQENPAGGATGMYTGSWGPSGKLAILHEKEIVLNKEDTKNFLDALDIVRSLQLSMLNNVTSITPATLGSLRMIQDLPDREPIQQTVTIEADFSGVQNSKEIEEAFENIINLARQHAYSTLQS